MRVVPYTSGGKVMVLREMGGRLEALEAMRKDERKYDKMTLKY